MTFYTDRLNSIMASVLDGPIETSLGTIPAVIIRVARDIQETEEFEARLAQLVPDADRDRWLAVARDWTDRLLIEAREHGRPNRWLIAELRDRLIQAAAGGSSIHDLAPIRDVTPPKLLRRP